MYTYPRGDFLFLLRDFQVMPRHLVLFGMNLDNKGSERERARERDKGAGESALG